MSKLALCFAVALCSMGCDGLQPRKNGKIFLPGFISLRDMTQAGIKGQSQLPRPKPQASKANRIMRENVLQDVHGGRAHYGSLPRQKPGPVGVAASGGMPPSASVARAAGNPNPPFQGEKRARSVVELADKARGRPHLHSQGKQGGFAIAHRQNPQRTRAEGGRKRKKQKSH